MNKKQNKIIKEALTEFQKAMVDAQEKLLIGLNELIKKAAEDSEKKLNAKEMAELNKVMEKEMIDI